MLRIFSTCHLLMSVFHLPYWSVWIPNWCIKVDWPGWHVGQVHRTAVVWTNGYPIWVILTLDSFLRVVLCHGPFPSTTNSEQLQTLYILLESRLFWACGTVGLRKHRWRNTWNMLNDWLNPMALETQTTGKTRDGPCLSGSPNLSLFDT